MIDKCLSEGVEIEMVFFVLLHQDRQLQKHVATFATERSLISCVRCQTNVILLFDRAGIIFLFKNVISLGSD